MKFFRYTLFALLVIGIALAIIYRDALDAAALAAWVKDAGAAGPLLFMLIYAMGTVLFLPGSVLTLTGGALFGPLWGTLYNLTGATVAFLIARYLCMLPGAIAYTYLGYAGREAVAGGEGLMQKILLAIARPAYALFHGDQCGRGPLPAHRHPGPPPHTKQPPAKAGGCLIYFRHSGAGSDARVL